METITNFKKFVLNAGFFLLVTAVTSCSDDDIDNDVFAEVPSGIIQINNSQTLSGNILSVPEVTVGQDSWLVAVRAGEENSSNFIAGPVLVEKGTTSNVQLTFDESVVNYNLQSAQVILKLYAENTNSGKLGEWDISDKPIEIQNNFMARREVTIYADLTNYNPFRHTFDLNADGSLDPEEVLKTYPNNFGGLWDIDKDGHLNPEEFYNTVFLNTDSNRDNVISNTEWNEGYLQMFGNWVENAFPSFDNNTDGRLSRSEWNEVFKDSGYFESNDSDSNTYLTQTELNQGFFEKWDSNDDTKIDEDEFNVYRPYVLNWTFLGYWDY